MEKGHTITKMETGDLKLTFTSTKWSNRFEGLMKAGKFEGKGKFFFGSLDKFEGDFTSGK